MSGWLELGAQIVVEMLPSWVERYVSPKKQLWVALAFLVVVAAAFALGAAWLVWN